jgi:hypothetical protein
MPWPASPPAAKDQIRAQKLTKKAAAQLASPEAKVPVELKVMDWLEESSNSSTLSSMPSTGSSTFSSATPDARSSTSGQRDAAPARKRSAGSAGDQGTCYISQQPSVSSDYQQGCYTQEHEQQQTEHQFVASNLGRPLQEAAGHAGPLQSSQQQHGPALQEHCQKHKQKQLARLLIKCEPFDATGC